MLTMQEVYATYKVRVASNQDHHTRSGWLNASCVYCDPHKQKFHLGYNLRFRKFSCWKCGKHEFVKTICLLTGMSLGNAIELKKKIKPILLGPSLLKHNGVYQPPSGVGPLTRYHIAYLRKVRKLDPTEMVNVWGIAGIAVDVSEWAWRLFLPIRYRGTDVSWTTRAIRSDCEIRYRSAAPERESISHKHLVYGLDLCRNGTISVHEGPLDALSIGRGGTCLFGVNWTPQQFVQIVSFPRRIICFDNEPKAQERARKLTEDLKVFPGETFNVVLETGKDANGADPVEVQEYRHHFGIGV